MFATMERVDALTVGVRFTKCAYAGCNQNQLQSTNIFATFPHSDVAVTPLYRGTVMEITKQVHVFLSVHYVVASVLPISIVSVSVSVSLSVALFISVGVHALLVVPLSSSL